MISATVPERSAANRSAFPLTVSTAAPFPFAALRSAAAPFGLPRRTPRAFAACRAARVRSAIRSRSSSFIRRIYQDTINGAGEHAIAQALNAELVPIMGRGKMWHRSTVSKILRNAAVVGTLVPGRLDYSTGKRVRVFEAPIANFYPAAVSMAEWTAVRAIKDGSIARARGKSAGAPIQNMLAGLARCPECGAAMTRVYKGSAAKFGRPKLVCTKAKAGAAAHGYVSVAIDAVHDAIASGWPKLSDGVPAGNRELELDRQAYDLQGEISGTEDRLAELLDLLDRKPSFVLSSRVQAAEASLAALRASLQSVEQARAVADGGLIHSRLEALEGAFDVDKAEAFDVGKVNAALRLLFSGVTVDYRTGWLRFDWRQGGVTELVYAMAPDSGN